MLLSKHILSSFKELLSKVSKFESQSFVSRCVIKQRFLLLDTHFFASFDFLPFFSPSRFFLSFECFIDSLIGSFTHDVSTGTKFKYNHGLLTSSRNKLFIVSEREEGRGMKGEGERKRNEGRGVKNEYSC